MSESTGPRRHEILRRPDAARRFFSVEVIHPAPIIMSFPASAPSAVRNGIIRASKVLFADPGLAATALRSTVEGFLTEAGVGSRASSGGFRSLERRLTDWCDGNPTHSQVANLLDAIRWLGNEGTHEDANLTVAEVMEGATILDEALHRWYTGPDLEAKAAAIIGARGSVRAT